MLDYGDVARHRFPGGHPDLSLAVVPDLFRREGSGESAAPIHQCTDLRFGGRAFRYGLPGVLQGAFPAKQAASSVAPSSFEDCGNVLDLNVEFGYDIIAVDWGLAGVHRVWLLLLRVSLRLRGRRTLAGDIDTAQLPT